MKIVRKKILNVCLIVAMLLTLLPGVGKIQAAGGLVVTPVATANELVNHILGSGITASNATVTGAAVAFGAFTGGKDIIGFENGIILSTGKAADVVGPNSSTNKSTNNNTAGDSDLTVASKVSTFDAAVLEFDFVPASDTLSFQYVFSSEEYNMYANTEYNDTFAFFVNGVNAAIVPGSEPPIPVSINTVNGGNPFGTDAKNEVYFINNEMTTRGSNSVNTAMNGLTVVMSVSIKVNAGVTNHIKLAIADGSDRTLDSNVFIKAGSLNDREARPGRMEINTRASYDVRIDRAVGSDGTATVGWKAKDEDGKVVASDTVTFADGEEFKIITVPATTVTVELSNPTGGATIGDGHESQPLSEIPDYNAIPPSSPSIDVTTPNPPTSVEVALTAEPLASIQYKLGNGDWQSYTGPITISENTTIVARAVGQNGLTSQESSYTVTTVISRSPQASDISANATTETVTVQNVPPGGTIEVYDENDELIGTATNTGETEGQVEVLIPGGLGDKQPIKVVQRETGKPASQPVNLTAEYDPSTAPAAENIAANATTGIITLKNVPVSVLVSVYGHNGNEWVLITSGTNTEGQDEFHLPVPGGLAPGQQLQVSLTEPNKAESPFAEVTAVYDPTEPLQSDQTSASATTGELTVKGVPAGATVYVYDGAGGVLGTSTNTEENPASLVIPVDGGLEENQTIYVSITEVKKSESDKITVQAVKELSATLDSSTIAANATTNEVILTDIPLGALITVTNKQGEIIGSAIQNDPSTGTLKVAIPGGLQHQQEIFIAITEDRKLESGTVSVIASKETTAAPDEGSVLANATTGEVTVRQVPAGATVNVYDSTGKPIGQKVSNGSIAGEVIIAIETGLVAGEQVKITITETDKLESSDVTVTAAKDPSAVPSRNDVLANATNDIVTVRNVVPGAVISVFDADTGEVIGTASNEGVILGEVRVAVEVVLKNGQELNVTVTEPKKSESGAVKVTAVADPSYAPAEGSILADATTKGVTVKQVPAGAVVRVYDAQDALIGTASNDTGATATVTVSIEGELNDNQSIKVTLTEVRKQESQPASATAQKQPTASLEESDVLANATTSEATIQRVPANATVRVYTSEGVLIGTGTNEGAEPAAVIIETDVELQDGQSLQVTVTEFRKRESAAVTVIALLEPSSAPSIEGATADVNTRTVKVPSVPVGATVTVYDEKGQVIGHAVNETNIEGTVELTVDVELEHEQPLRLTITEKGRAESVAVGVQALKSDDDAVNDAARLLKIGFSDGDTWESVTAPLFLLTAGHYATNVSWTSSKPSVIELTEPANHEIVSVIHRQARDTSVVLTATVSKNGKQAVRTFLLIVKASGSQKEENTDYIRNVNVSDGSDTVATLPIRRIEVTDQNGGKSNIDKVIFTQDKAEELSGSAGSGVQEVNIIIDELPGDAPEEIAVEVPAGAVAAIADEGLKLNVQTEYAVLTLDAAQIEAMKQNYLDLFFRLVPIKQEAAKQDVKKEIPSDYDSMQVSLLGNPLEIDTNYSGYATSLFIPFAKSGIDITSVNLSRLRVHIIHSDGEKEMQQGTIVYNDQNEPIGMTVQIDKFSTFSIVELKNYPYQPLVASSITIKANLGSDNDADGTAALDVDVKRSTSPDGSKSDSIIILPGQVEGVIDEVREKGQNGIKIVIPDDKKEVRSTEVTLEAGTPSLFASEGIAITIETSQGTVSIPAKSLADINGAATITIDAIGSSTGWKPASETLKQVDAVIGNLPAPAVVGSPVQIGGSLSGRAVTVSLPITLPLMGNEAAGGNQEIDDKLQSLALYIEKADGTSKLVKGTVVKQADGSLRLSAEAEVGDKIALLQWDEQDLEDFWDSIAPFHVKYMNGYPDGTFKPERGISRAQLAAAMVRGLGLEAGISENPTTGFADVAATHWAAGYISVAVDMGLMTGYPDGEFKPERVISRAEMASFAARYEKLSFTEHEGAVSPISDVDNHWGASAIDAVVASGIMTGYEDGTFAPNRELKRSEAVTIINRLLRRGPLYNLESPAWSDVPESHWAYHDIAEASLDHSYELVNGREEWK
ncbi:choice-of-anchor L domain-containing protein [Paenibacillus sp. CAU 1782]